MLRAAADRSTRVRRRQEKLSRSRLNKEQTGRQPLVPCRRFGPLIVHLAQLNAGYVIRDGTAQYNKTTTRHLTVRLLVMFVVTNVHRFVRFCALVRCHRYGRAIHSDAVPLSPMWFDVVRCGN